MALCVVLGGEEAMMVAVVWDYRDFNSGGGK
jgi:hypothetical protein